MVRTRTSPRAFLWRDGTVTDLGTLGGTTTLADGGREALNERGDVVGLSATGSSLEPFRRRDGVMSQLPKPPGTWFAQGNEVTDRGLVHGVALAGDGLHGVVWHRDGTVLDLGAAVTLAAANERDWLAGTETRGGIPVATLWRPVTPSR